MKKDRLSKVLFDLAMMGADRAALVRPAQDGKPAGACIIMEGETALVQLGDKLRPVMRELGNAPADFGVPDIDEDVGLQQLFEIAETAPNGWCWAAFNFGHMKITVAIFVRNVFEVAKICTENRAPCSLDPTEPAKGWQLLPYPVKV